MTDPNIKMRKLVIAGSYAQYRDYIAREHLHQRAAPYIERGEQLLDYDPELDEVVLVGQYRDNLAYQSQPYWWFVGQQLPVAQSI